LPILLQTSLQQFVLHGDAAEQITICKSPAVVGFIRWAQNFTQLKPSPGAHDYSAAAWIAHGVHSRKTANLAHRADSY
jgi:hypothetical protein